jgi:WD40 repeat protein
MTKNIFVIFAFISVMTDCYPQIRDGNVQYKTENKIIYGICFTDKGEVLGIADGSTVKAYLTRTGELLGEFKNGNEDIILTINISGDSTLLASGGRDSTIQLWNFVSKKLLKSLNYHKGKITSVCLSPDSRFLLSGSTDNKVILYDITTDKVVKEFTEHTGDVTSVTFSSDGQLFASAGEDGLVNIYDTGKMNLVISLSGHTSWVRNLCFSNDGKKLLSVGDDSRAIIWDISDINNKVKMTESKNGISWLLCADFFADSKTFAVGDLRGHVKISGQFMDYKIKLGKPVQKVLFKPNEGDVIKIAIATRGKGVVLIDAKNIKQKEY